MEKLIDISSYPVANVLDLLLQDKSTKKNIIWATDTYEELGEGFTDKVQILSLIHILVAIGQKQLIHTLPAADEDLIQAARLDQIQNLLGAVHHHRARPELQIRPGQHNIQPVFQRLSSWKIRQRLAPHNNRAAACQRPKMYAVLRNHHRLGTAQAYSPIFVNRYN